MSFYDFNKYSDVVFAREFEGLDYYHNFTKSEMHDIYASNKWVQLLKYSPSGKKVWMSKLLSKPVTIMKNILKDKSTVERLTKSPKFFMYSAHDNTISVLWEYLNAKNFDWYYIPFASYVQIKVYIDFEDQLRAFAYANGVKLDFGL